MKKKLGYAYYRNSKKKGYRQVFRIIFLFVLFCSVIQVVKTFFIDVYSVKNVSMAPALKEKSRAVISPLAYGVKNPFTGKALDFISSPKRGDMVVMVSPAIDLKSWPLRYLDQYIRFISFQKLSSIYRYSPEWGSAFLIKRIIALPGETVYIKDYEAFIKKDASDNYISEKLLINADYSLQKGAVIGSEAPFCTDREAVVLSDNQYYLLGDNRPFSLDSRNYGPVERDRITGRVLFTY